MVEHKDISKLVIKGYKKDPTGPKSSPNELIKQFKALIQPNNVFIEKGVQFSQNDTANTNFVKKQYHGYSPVTFGMELILDSTKKNIDGTVYTIKDKVKELEDTIYIYEGEIHKPLYLRVTWGDIDYYSHIKKYDIKYYLFSIEGKPARARISLTFESYASPEYLERRANNQSPDMTHVKTFREGDNILSMSREVYGDSKYFVQVAEYNDLINFRNIKPGTQLIFPPLK